MPYVFLILLKSLSVILLRFSENNDIVRTDNIVITKPISIDNTFKYSSEYRENIAKQVMKDGWAIIPAVLNITLIKTLRDVEFPPLLRRRMQSGDPDRGAGRYYLTPPFEKSWADERLIAQPDILDVVFKVVGRDAVLCQVGMDTPLGGGASEMQEIHRDCGSLFDDEDMAEPPPYQLAVNFPLVDVLPAERGSVGDLGPLEIHKGSHKTSVKLGKELIKAGKIELEPIYMRAGDVLIRDVRVLHRGTPNFGPHPRPVGVIGYSIKWLRRPEVGIKVTKEYLNNASPILRSLLRYEDVVDQIEPYSGMEKYGAEKLEETSGGSFTS